MPAAYLPISLAVAGAITTRSAVWPRRVCGIGSAPPASAPAKCGSARPDASAENVERADEPLRVGGEHRAHVHAGIDQTPADLDCLVRRDAAGDAQDDSRGYHRRPGTAGIGSGRSVARVVGGETAPTLLGRFVVVDRLDALVRDLAGRDLFHRDRQRLA